MSHFIPVIKNEFYVGCNQPLVHTIRAIQFQRVPEIDDSFFLLILPTGFVIGLKFY